ncbi:MAG: acyl-CoA dehydrogenase family protein [Myxococcota bacterium]|nr:acyl-CoA dehydrogenase family protein [Myxococcota bacterium]
MDFGFSEEQETIRQLAREILEAEAPIERVKAAEATPEWRDEALWKQLAEANLLGIAIAETHGGMGMGLSELCVLLEEIGRVVAPGPWLPSLVLGALPIGRFGTEAQQARWLPSIASGELVATAALDDAGSSHLDAPATTARADGGGFVLDGVKRDVPGLTLARLALIPARTAEGTAIFAVDPRTEGASVETGALSTGEPLGRLVLEGVRVGEDARLPGDGTAQLRWLAARSRVGLAALQVGVSDRAIAITADYTREREQFGVPIGSFQAVQHRLADAWIDLEAMRWTLWHAVYRLDQGLPAEREARVAKFWAADGGSRIARACVHLHGGLGSDIDYPIQRHFRWSKALELCQGGATETLAGLGADMAHAGPVRDGIEAEVSL